MDAAEVHQRLLETASALVARTRGRRRDLHRPRDRVLHRVLDGDDVEPSVRLLHLEGEVGGQRRGLAVAGGAADEDAAVQRHADLGEHRRLFRREAETLQGHAALDAVAVEQAGEQVIAVGFVRAALTAQRGDGGGERHLAAGADREALEGAALVAGLGRPLVLAVEQEAHGLAALVRRHRLGERQLAVVDDAEDAAGPAVVLEGHVGGPRRRRVFEQPPHPAGDLRCLAARFHPVAGFPPGSDVLQGRGLLAQAVGNDARLAERQQLRPQAVVGLVAGGDQAAPVRVHRADPPEARVHGGMADRRGIRFAGGRRHAPVGAKRQPHRPSPEGRGP